MIARTVQLFIFLCFLLSVLSACQEQNEKPHDNLKPTTSHRTVKEKKVIVPPDVARRWAAVKLAVIDKTRGTENIYVVPIGAQFKVPSSSLTILVDAFLPAFIMEGTTITSSSNKLENPGAKVLISENGTIIFQGWLFSKFPNTHAVTHPKYGFSLIGAVPVSQ